MGTITVPNVGNFEVDDSFAHLPPDQQHQIVAQMVSHVTQGPSATPPDGSLGNAAGQSIVHGLPAALASGLSGATRWIESATGRNDPTALGNAGAEDQFAASQRLAQAQNYQRPDSVAPSVYAGFAQGQGIGGKIARAGQAALYGAAENAGPLAASLVATPLAAAGLPEAAGLGILGRGAVLASDGLQALSGVRDAKAKAGLDPNQVSTGDIVNAAGQTALQMVPGAEAMPLLRPFLRGAEGAARGVVAPLANDLGAVAQGGHLDTSTVASDALDGAASGAVIGGAMAAPGALKDTAVNAANTLLDPSRAGPGAAALSAVQKAQPAWDSAVQAAKDKLAPTLPKWADLQGAAEAAAINNGAVKPDMTPEAQQGAARLALLQMFQARKAAEPQRDDTGKADANTFKGINDDLGGVIANIGKSLLSTGLIDKDTHDAITAANAEAGKHNRNLAEDGQDSGYINTALDKVQQAQLDPQYRDLLTALLRVRDDAASNGMLNATKGPLEKNAGTLLPLVGGVGGLAGGVFAGLGPGVEAAAAGLGANLVKAVGTSWLRKLDSTMGWNQPKALDGSDAFLRLAQARGLTPAVTSQGIIDAQQSLAGLRATPQGASVPNPAAGPQGPAQGAPVTASGRYPVPPSPPPAPGAPPGPQMATGGPAMAPQSPEMAPQGPMQAPMAQPAPMPMQARPPMAPPAPPAPSGDPLRQAAQMAQAQMAQRQQAEAAMAQRIQQMAPSERQPWSGSMADTLGVQHAPMIAAIRQLAANDPELSQTIGQENIPRPIMVAITNRMADLRDAGTLPRSATAAGGGSIGAPSVQDQMRLMAYRASVEQAQAAANQVRGLAPAGVATIEAMSTTKEKKAALQTYLAAIPDPVDRARQEAILAPLTLFGSKKDGTLEGPTTPPTN